MKKTEKKRFLVTGAASGLGAAVCERLFALGHHVIALDIKKPLSCGDMRFFEADITDEKSLLMVKETLAEENILLDGIFDIAGVHAMVSLAEGDLARMKRLLEVNLMGTMAVNRVFYPLLAKEGRILIVTSEVATLAPLPFNGLYSVSKAALDAYAQALRQELNLLGQKVITIRPGAIETPLAKGSMADTEALAAQTVLFQRGADRFARIARKFMGRPMKAEVLARLICRAALAKHPRLVYHKHRNAGLVLLGALPIRWQCAVIKLLLR